MAQNGMVQLSVVSYHIVSYRNYGRRQLLDYAHIIRNIINNTITLRGYSIIGYGSGFTVNLGSDSLGKSNDLGVSNVM